MRTFLATCLIVCFAGPATAQISAGPMGPFALVDDNEDLIGGMMTEAHVTLSTPGGVGVVAVWSGGGDRTLDTFVSSKYRYFTTTDCSGTVYGDPSDGLLGVDGGPRLWVAHGGALQTNSGPATPVQHESYRGNGGTGNCIAQSSSAQALYPLTDIGDLATEFTPPFHIVTVQSQMAAVPIQFGWLLGGFLLGLGIKAVGRRQ